MPDLTSGEYWWLGAKILVALLPLLGFLGALPFIWRQGNGLDGTVFCCLGALITVWGLWVIHDDYLVEPPPPFEYTAAGFKCRYWGDPVPWNYFSKIAIQRRHGTRHRRGYELRLDLRPEYIDQARWSDHTKKLGFTTCWISDFRRKAIAQSNEVSVFVRSLRPK